MKCVCCVYICHDFSFILYIWLLTVHCFWNFALSTILVIIFRDFLMFYQIFLSPQVKQIMIISKKHGICQLPHKKKWRNPKESLYEVGGQSTAITSLFLITLSWFLVHTRRGAWLLSLCGFFQFIWPVFWVACRFPMSSVFCLF